MISEYSAHSTPLPVGFRTGLWRYTCLLLLIAMLWHRQAIFESEGDKLPSSAECGIRIYSSYQGFSPIYKRTHSALWHNVLNQSNFGPVFPLVFMFLLMLVWRIFIRIREQFQFFSTERKHAQLSENWFVVSRVCWYCWVPVGPFKPTPRCSLHSCNHRGFTLLNLAYVFDISDQLTRHHVRHTPLL